MKKMQKPHKYILFYIILFCCVGLMTFLCPTTTLCEKQNAAVALSDESADIKPFKKGKYYHMNLQTNTSDKITKAIMSTSNLSFAQANKIAKLMDKITTEYELKYGFKKNIPLLLAIVHTESTFKFNAQNKNAKGLMQVTPIALKSVCNDWGTNPNSYNMFNEEDNLRVGYYYIMRNVNNMGTETALVAYNSGYKKIRKRVIASRGKTNSYLNKVLNKSTRYTRNIK